MKAILSFYQNFFLQQKRNKNFNTVNDDQLVSDKQTHIYTAHTRTNASNVLFNDSLPVIKLANMIATSDFNRSLFITRQRSVKQSMITEKKKEQ